MDYIRAMRKKIGNDTLLTIGCGAIIENSLGQILLLKREDFDEWGIPGGLLDLGETFEDAVKREVLEEANLQLREISLFGLYSGSAGYAQYANGDKVFSVQIIFLATEFIGNIKLGEGQELRFFHKNDLPSNINPHQAPFITDWVNEVTTPIIK